MSKSILIILGVVVIAGVGWYLWDSGMLMQPGNEGENTMEETNEVVVALAEQNGSGEMGTATLSEADGTLKVVLELTGAPAGVTQPAHIHFESCANIGGVKYPLNSPVNGYSETIVDVSMAELQAGLPLSLNVHKSVEEASVYVACGNVMIP
ncbi:MAG TPA: hypothetical protein VFE94_04640 [Candidatus Paceibacterota bacterium]|nr:hypothetical protein [Candidatus Paceibacterota bacterium]